MKSRKPLYKKWYIWLIVIIIVSKISISTDEEVIKDSQNNIDTIENTNESKFDTEYNNNLEKEQKEDKFILEGINDEILLKNIEEAFESIQIDISDVKKFKKAGSWVSGQRYEFVYKNSPVEMYINEDKTVSSVDISNIKVYDQGKEPLNVSDYIMDIEMTNKLAVWAEDTVKNALKYPSSTKFPLYDGWSYGRNKNIYAVSGYVKAKNAFNVEDKLNFYIEYKVEGNNKNIKYFVLDGQKMIGDKSVFNIVDDRKELLGEKNDNTITLTYGLLGEYGEIIKIEGFEYIWYHVPKGKYKVQSNTSYSKLYVDKNTLTDEPENVVTLSFDDTSKEEIIEIKDNQHIEITMSSKVTLIPID